MTIDQAIECLERAKEKGVKSIVIAFWEAEMFGREDDERWEEIAEHLDEMDWSNCHADLERQLEEFEFVNDDL
jgi:hypothetical protein